MSYLDQFFNLNGKVAVMTGAGGHLIGEFARGLSRAGVKVVVADVRMEKALSIVHEIESEGGIALPFEMNVSKKEEFGLLLEKSLNVYGDVDILINGAGINAPTPFFEITEKEWDDIMAVQLKGTLFGCQIFGEYMIQRKKGSIINISSASANPPLSKAFTYSVAKAGIKNLTQNIAREWGQKGVRVNALRPGFFPTEWSMKNFLSQERIDSILNHTPMKRFGQPAELLGAVLWLSSDASQFVTGAEIAVDGGFSCMTI